MLPEKGRNSFFFFWPAYYVILTMPLIFKLDESVPKPDTSFNLWTLNLNSCSETESEYFVSRLKHDDIHSLLKFVEECDEKICFVNTKEEETSLSIAIYRVKTTLCMKKHINLTFY